MCVHRIKRSLKIEEYVLLRVFVELALELCKNDLLVPHGTQNCPDCLDVCGSSALQEWFDKCGNPKNRSVAVYVADEVARSFA